MTSADAPTEARGWPAPDCDANTPPAMLINCVAYQDGRKLADIRVDDIDDVRQPAGLLRLGRAARRQRCRAANDAAASSGCTTWRSRTPATATSGRRSRSTTTPCSSCCTRSSSTRSTSCASARSTSSSAELRALVRNRSQHGLLGVRAARRARAAAAARTAPAFVLLRADGRGRRPLLPDHRRARDRTRGRSRRRSSSRGARAPTSSSSTR